MTRQDAIELRSLRKSFGKREVLCGVDLQIPEGARYALGGPWSGMAVVAAESLHRTGRLAQPCSSTPYRDLYVSVSQ